MSALIATAVPPEMIQEYQSDSVSKELAAMLEQIALHIEDTASRAKTPIADALAEIRDECGEGGWDGQDALPVKPGALKEAEIFAKQLPYSLPLPHVAPTPSGGVAFEWRHGRDTIVLLTVTGMQRVAYAAVIDGARKIHATEPFIETIPRSVEEILVSNFRPTA